MTTSPSFEPSRKVPDNLVRELHEATEDFHNKRERLDAVHEDFQAELGAREDSIVQVRDADRRLEEIRRKITEAVAPKESR